MNFGLTFLRTEAKNVHIIFRKPQTRSPISAWTLFHTSRKWVETMFRTWYSASQIYTTIVIIFASSGMDLYFVPRWSVVAVNFRNDWTGLSRQSGEGEAPLLFLFFWLWYPRWKTNLNFHVQVFHEVSAGWSETGKGRAFGTIFWRGVLWRFDPQLGDQMRSWSCLTSSTPFWWPLCGKAGRKFTAQKSTWENWRQRRCRKCCQFLRNFKYSWSSFWKKSSNHIPRMWWWWCVIRCSWKHTCLTLLGVISSRTCHVTYFWSLWQSYICGFMMQNFRFFLCIQALKNENPVDSRDGEGVQGVVPYPGTRHIVHLYLNRVSWAKKCTKINS